jgi:putative salt-induced outer membrane protein YdiY
MLRLKNILILTALFSLPVLADDSSDNKKSDFSISVGYVQTTGNTETSTLNIQSSYDYKFNSKKINFDLNALYGKTSGVKTAENITADLRAEKNFKPYFIFWDVHYYRNPFQAYEHSIGTGPGIGRYFYDSEKIYLTGSYYVYYVYNKLNQPSYFSGTETENYFLHNIEERFRIKITENLKFKQRLIYKVTSRRLQDYFVYFESSLVNKLADNLALKISYTANYQNIPVGSKIKRLDTTFSTLVQFSF